MYWPKIQPSTFTKWKSHIKITLIGWTKQTRKTTSFSCTRWHHFSFKFLFYHKDFHAYFRQLLFMNMVWSFTVKIFPGAVHVCTWLAIPVRCFGNRQSLGECGATWRNRKAGRYFQNSAWHDVTFTNLQPEYQAKPFALFTRHISAHKIH